MLVEIDEGVFMKMPCRISDEVVDNPWEFDEKPILNRTVDDNPPGHITNRAKVSFDEYQKLSDSDKQKYLRGTYDE